MEAQFGRVARMFWRTNAEMELTEVWTDRLAGMSATLQRYRKNAYAYIWATRDKGYYIGDETTYPVPASVYAKQV